jgi:transposase-like protein
VDPTTQFCHNLDCPQRGQVGQGNIGVQSRRDRRYRCKVCDTTFSATKGTTYYRLHTAVNIVTIVLTLLCHGCPLQAIVAAFGLDERTVASWQARAGQHCQAVHDHLIVAGQVDVQHVQADELWVKLVRKRVWMAMALAVPSRLWLGGVVSEHRDLALIVRVVHLVRMSAMTVAILVCVDGLSSYVTAFRRVFRQPVHTGHRGRPRLVAEPGLLLAQVVKQYTQRHVVSVSRRVVQGSAEAIAAVLARSHGGKEINTAYIERLNATFRSALAPLTRRGRALAHSDTVLTAGMSLVGSAYNFCWVHASLRHLAIAGSALKWQERTPALAAGITDHVWTMSELLHYQVPLSAWVPPKRRGRPPKASSLPARGAVA